MRYLPLLLLSLSSLSSLADDPEDWTGRFVMVKEIGSATIVEGGDLAGKAYQLMPDSVGKVESTIDDSTLRVQISSANLTVDTKKENFELHPANSWVGINVFITDRALLDPAHGHRHPHVVVHVDGVEAVAPEVSFFVRYTDGETGTLLKSQLSKTRPVTTNTLESRWVGHKVLLTSEGRYKRKNPRNVPKKNAITSSFRNDVVTLERLASGFVTREIRSTTEDIVEVNIDGGLYDIATSDLELVHHRQCLSRISTARLRNVP